MPVTVIRYVPCGVLGGTVTVNPSVSEAPGDNVTEGEARVAVKLGSSLGGAAVMSTVPENELKAVTVTGVVGIIVDPEDCT